ncbi:hypothetical protein Poly41_44280 [Novipirellula artificiosorum]|uniref:Uncharacterized protein n=1 Tax=Novipirellula artificiosorum TaxID=2528016 RepID=A0A5C6DEV4_9BACT|nr:hypothetical protein Poly41_44280 [Novipirellula artificiosorum]
MSKRDRIMTLKHGQGFTANVVTSIIVIGASRFGLLASSPHVRCGALCKIFWKQTGG